MNKIVHIMDEYGACLCEPILCIEGLHGYQNYAEWPNKTYWVSTDSQYVDKASCGECLRALSLKDIRY